MTTLTMTDDKRLDVIQRVFRSELTVTQAALVLGVSERQCYRVKARIERIKKTGIQQIAIIPCSPPGGSRDETIRGFAKAMS